MIKNFIFTCISLFTIFTYSQQTIRLDFKPKLNTNYEYITQFFVNNNNHNLSSNASASLNFQKKKDGYKVLQEFTNVEFSKRNKLFFFLNQKIDSTKNYKIHILQKFLTQKNNFFHIDNKGNLVKNIHYPFLEKNNYLRPRDKELLKEYTKNLNFNILNFFSQKTFKVNEPFVIRASEAFFLNNINQLTGKLIAVIENKAIFKLQTEFYTPIRNRRREITGKELNKIDAVLVINKLDGMPLQMRMLFHNKNTTQLISQHLKGQPHIQIKNFTSITNSSNNHTTIKTPKYYKKPNKDSLKIAYKKFFFNSKPTIEKALKNINPFKINSRRNCVKLSIDISSHKKSILVDIKKIKAYDAFKKLLFEQDISTEFQLIDYEHPIDIPLGYELCDLPISYFEIDSELSAIYGDVKEIPITLKNSLKHDILNWSSKEVEMKNMGFYSFYNANNKEIPVSNIKLNNFSSNIKEKIPFLKTDFSAKNYFLFTNLLTRDNSKSYQLYFNDEVKYINKIKLKNKMKISRSIKLSVDMQ